MGYKPMLLTVVFLLVLYCADSKKLKDKSVQRVVRDVGLDAQMKPDIHEAPFYSDAQREPTESYGERDVNGYRDKPYLHKPKSLKILSAYDVCKQECKKQRDQESEKEYVDRLREELKFAEEQLLQKAKEQSEQATADGSASSSA
ncbi:hypothetical protein DdX_05641 [Ditylenchus destructor]|uniref:Uncharacterized protein n=1 Tax=Ditylenchus destructor TaxID=166010 RepID=A0AAD4N7L9_9BILA|nr:hypothetical protein DdX_05641 [Ditylenchus destructor]